MGNWSLYRVKNNLFISVCFSNSVTTSKRKWTLTMHTKNINVLPKVELSNRINNTTKIISVKSQYTCLLSTTRMNYSSKETVYWWISKGLLGNRYNCFELIFYFNKLWDKMIFLIFHVLTYFSYWLIYISFILCIN